MVILVVLEKRSLQKLHKVSHARRSISICRRVRAKKGVQTRFVPPNQLTCHEFSAGTVRLAAAFVVNAALAANNLQHGVWSLFTCSLFMKPSIRLRMAEYSY